MTTATTADQLASFVACVYEPDDIVEMRLLPSAAGKVDSNWHPAKCIPNSVPILSQKSAAGYNIYVGANPRRAEGGTTADEVALARCLFADFDNVDVQTAQERIVSVGLPTPTMTVNSGHGVHCWWRLTEPVTDLAAWTSYQRRLIAAVGSDKSIHDPPRIMRLPGFTNHKPPVAESMIIDADPKRVYPLAELLAVLPEIAKPEPGPQPKVNANGRLDVLTRVARYAETWESVAEPAKNGGEPGRNAAAYRHSAALARDFDLTDDEAWPILAAWNATNTPPLDEAELRTCLTKGRRHGTHTTGALANAPKPARAPGSKATGGNTSAPRPDAKPKRKTQIGFSLAEMTPPDGFFADYIAYGRSGTDACDEFHLAVGLSVLSTVVNKTVWVKYGHNRIYPVLWNCLIGKSTISRKTTVQKVGLDILRDYATGAARVAPQARRVMTGSMTIEAFLDEMGTMINRKGEREEDDPPESVCLRFRK